MNLDIAIILDLYSKLFHAKYFNDSPSLKKIQHFCDFRNHFYFPPISPSLLLKISSIVEYYIKSLERYRDLPTVISNIQSFLSRQTTLNGASS